MTQAEPNEPMGTEPAPGEVAPAVPAPPKRSALRRFFWMEDAIARAGARALTAKDAGFRELELARAAREAGAALFATEEPLKLSDGAPAALSLFREAAYWALAMNLLRDGRPFDPAQGHASLWAAAESTPAMADVARAMDPDARARARAAFVDRPFQLVATMDRATVAEELRALRALVDRLLDPVELDLGRVAALKLMRWARILGVAGLLVGSVAGGAVVWTIRARGPNLALHAATTQSSVLASGGGSPGGAVDGNTSSYGFHTDNDDPAWLRIDLAAPKTVARVVVYNRSDAVQDRAVPLQVELSNDGVTYSQVARRDDVFNVWTAQFPPQQARYVRLKVPRKTYLHLNEVEVYGR